MPSLELYRSAVNSKGVKYFDLVRGATISIEAMCTKYYYCRYYYYYYYCYYY